MGPLFQLLEDITARLGAENENWLKGTSRSSNMALSLLMIGLLAMLLIEVSPSTLDFLIGVNWATSLFLILGALYLPSAFHLSTLPAILFIAALCRLGMNLAITRQILLHATAGEFVFQFGKFLTHGNFLWQSNVLVGSIVFLVITLSLFITIVEVAKRTTKWAEIGLSTTIPSKQLEIDAAIRAGTLGAVAGHEKRLGLMRQGLFYRALTRAMGVVKADAIAALMMTMINIQGGLFIGVMNFDMTAGEAAQVFALLTIGAGLVWQIPALMASLAAGIAAMRAPNSGFANPADQTRKTSQESSFERRSH
ncbi:MAG: sctV [Chlamydiales bacterium]|jgi:type III secretion protein V|nr:sctV [Chlamydiales bacterium]